MRPPEDLPSWLQDDDIDSSTLLEVTMDDESRFTGKIGNISDDWERIEWNIVTNEAQRTRPSRKIVVRIRSIICATPVTTPLSAPRLPFDSLQPEALNRSTFSLQSGVLFALTLTAALGISMSRDWWWPMYWQAIAAAGYTVAILCGTFASIQYGSILPEIAFTRPEVRRALPRLLVIHIAFLVAWLILLTVAIAIHPALPAWVNSKIVKGSTPFTIAIAIVFFTAVSRHVSLNRRLLEDAKSGHSPKPASEMVS